MKEWVSTARQARADGKSWSETAKTVMAKHDMGDLDMYQVIRKCRGVCKTVKTPERALPFKQTLRVDGSMESIRRIELPLSGETSPEELLMLHGLDSGKWQITSYTNNVWEGMTGKENDNASKQLYQSKIVAKPKADGLCLSDIDDWFSKQRWDNKPVIKPIQYKAGGEVLEICVPDLHAGLLAWAKETGADYDIHITRDAFLQCISDIKQRCETQSFKHIYFVTLGDLLHTDNDNQTTTKGTFQQTDGRMAKIFDYALTMLITALDMLGQVAPVEVVYLSGNHDRNLGYMLIKSLEMAYRRDTNYVFDVSPNPQKFRLIGCSLIGWTHGDMPRKNIGLWLQDRARKEFGEAKFAEVHAGHFHSEKTKESYRTYDDEIVMNEGGIVVRHLPTICNSSFWEYQQGYPFGNKTMMSFVWHERHGLRAMWFSNL